MFMQRHFVLLSVLGSYQGWWIGENLIKWKRLLNEKTFELHVTRWQILEREKQREAGRRSNHIVIKIN